MNECWLAANAVYEREGPIPPCEGRLRQVHLIPQQLLKREGLGEHCLDPRGWVAACGGIMGVGGCHGRLDVSRTLRIPRASLPPEVEEMALDLALVWWLDRTYGPLP